MGKNKSSDEQADETGKTEGTEAGPESQEQSFDAVAAAAEFEAALSDQDPGEMKVASAEEYARLLESEVESMSSVLAQKQVIAQRAVERADRAVEEVELSKQRLKQEMDREVERRARKILGVFVEVLDDLDRAIAAAREMDHNPEVVAGVELVRKSFLAKLAGFEVEHQNAFGEPFDPSLHEAVSTTSVDDEAEDGKVAAVVREGYLIGAQVLRPAMVVVGKHEK